MSAHCSRRVPPRSRPTRRRVQCHMADADRYQRLQMRLALLSFGITLGYLLIVLATGAGHATAQWAARLQSTRWGQVALVALALGAAHGALSLPVSLVRGYWLPRRFGLADRLKATVIGGALGLA